MSSGIALVFLYSKTNRNSINALAGALEADPYFDSADMVFPRTGDELLQAVHDVLASRRRAAVAISFATTQLWAVREHINLDDYPPLAIRHNTFRPIEITRSG